MKVHLNLRDMVGTKGGIGVYIYQICKRAFNSDEFELSGFALNFLNRHPEALPEDFPPMEFKTNMLVPNTLYFSRFSKYIPFSYNWLAKDKADVSIFFSNQIPYKIKGKVIVVLHDLIPHMLPEMCSANYTKDARSNYAEVKEKASKVITISEFTKQEIIREIGIEESRVAVVPTGVEFEPFNKKYKEADYERVKKEYRLPEKYIFYIGGHHARKNVDGFD